MKKLIIAVIFTLAAANIHAQLGTTTRVPEGVCTAGAVGTDTICANANDHSLAQSVNNGTYQGIPLAYYTTGAAYTNATTAFSNVTGLSFSISANRTYHAVCHIVWQGSAGTTGPKYQWTGPSGSSASLASLFSSVTLSAFNTSTATTYSTALANTGSIATATNLTDLLEFSVVNGSTAGTVQLQAAANGAGTLTIQPASSCVVE